MTVKFVRENDLPALPPPASVAGPLAWAKTNLFSSVSNTIFTFIGIALVLILVPPVLNFLIFGAVWSGDTRDACIQEGLGKVACWPFIQAKWNQIVYGFYTADERWRVNVVWIIGAIALAAAMIPRVPYKLYTVIFLLVIYPIFAFIMFTGGHFELPGFLFAGSILPSDAGNIVFWLDYLILFIVLSIIVFIAGILLGFNPIKAIKNIFIFLALVGIMLFVCSVDFGMANVPTSRWGGIMVTLVVASVGIVISLPLGIILALGRRSNLPIIRLLCVMFIEFWRGVPLILVLFMASNLLPLFLPDGVNFDKLLRALLGVAFFASAYMAEVVRGGLQAIPKGQYEGASALGLTYWQSMQKIILPQALKLVIPGIVNTFIGLFKDTTLVLIIGIFDVLGVLQSAYNDPAWITPSTAMTGYVTAGLFYFIFCFGMSRYSVYIENKLHTGHKR
jgi:general L-amino acid transport system permease protein